MARAAFGATVGQALPDGRYNSSSGAAGSPDSAIAAVQALITAVTDAQTAAEANATISGNGTALGLVQAIGTAFTGMTASLTTAKTTASAKNVILDYDASVLTSRNQLIAAVRSIMGSVEGSGMLT